MATSFFITLDKPIYVGGNKYCYNDQIVYEKEVQKCKNKKQFYENICNNAISHLYVEGQNKHKMDYAIKKYMHVFVRTKTSNYVYIGTVDTVEMLQDNTEFNPASYKLSIDSTCKSKNIIDVENKKLNGASKIAAFQYLDLPIPISFNPNVGIFDHDPNYKSSDHPIKKYVKPAKILDDLERQIKVMTQDHVEIDVLFSLYANISKSKNNARH